MSKHLKKKNPPAPSSDEEDDPLSQELADPVAVTAVGSTKGPCKDMDVEPSSSPAAEDGWKRLVKQFDSLQAVLLNLVTLVASSMASGPAQEMPPVEERAAIAPASGAMWCETAILGAAASARPDAAIFSEQQGMRPGEVASAGDGSIRQSNGLPNIKEFSAGGDWNVFTWRFESAFRSVKWTEDEALEALPTMLDDVSLAVFRSIPSGRKNTLRDAFAEMSEICEPPSNAQRKFMHRRRGVNESPLAYRGALVALTMAAYPNPTADLLDPLILTKMLELSKEMDISLPVCGYELLTSRWAARCLDAKVNISQWKQMAAWTGDPAKDGEPEGWAPSRVVDIQDDDSNGELAAAAPRWVPQRGPMGAWGSPRCRVDTLRGPPVVRGRCASSAARWATSHATAGVVPVLPRRPGLHLRGRLQGRTVYRPRHVGTHRTPSMY
ncbi:unnamed protein product [Lampetra fluviatilis]